MGDQTNEKNINNLQNKQVKATDANGRMYQNKQFFKKVKNIIVSNHNNFNVTQRKRDLKRRCLAAKAILCNSVRQWGEYGENML